VVVRGLRAIQTHRYHAVGWWWRLALAARAGGSRCLSARAVGSRWRLRRRALPVRGAGEGPNKSSTRWKAPMRLLLLRNPEIESRTGGIGTGHRGCERGVRVSLVSLHAPVTGRPAFSRGLWCFRRPAGAVQGATARVPQAGQRVGAANTASCVASQPERGAGDRACAGPADELVPLVYLILTLDTAPEAWAFAPPSDACDSHSLGPADIRLLRSTHVAQFPARSRLWTW
jgi:hypothetical protein